MDLCEKHLENFSLSANRSKESLYLHLDSFRCSYTAHHEGTHSKVMGGIAAMPFLLVNYPNLKEEASCFADSACSARERRVEVPSPQAWIPAVPAVFIISLK